jgi:hypothetical protein
LSVVDDGQVLPGQHGSKASPHDWQKWLLALHTSVLPALFGQSAPLATQVLVVPLVLQQPPPVHWLPLQQGSPAPPQAWHEVPWQTEAPFAHVSPVYRHVLEPGSQHPVSHAVPLVQQAAPVVPHVGVVLMEVEQLCALWAALWQLALAAVSVALVSSVPALVHLMFPARQLMTGWNAEHSLSSCSQAVTVLLALPWGSLGQVSCEQEAFEPLEPEQATVPPRTAAKATTQVRSVARLKSIGGPPRVGRRHPAYLQSCVVDEPRRRQAGQVSARARYWHAGRHALAAQLVSGLSAGLGYAWLHFCEHAAPLPDVKHPSKQAIAWVHSMSL